MKYKRIAYTHTRNVCIYGKQNSMQRIEFQLSISICNSIIYMRGNIAPRANTNRIIIFFVSNELYIIQINTYGHLAFQCIRSNLDYARNTAPAVQQDILVCIFFNICILFVGFRESTTYRFSLVHASYLRKLFESTWMVRKCNNRDLIYVLIFTHSLTCCDIIHSKCIFCNTHINVTIQ